MWRRPWNQFRSVTLGDVRVWLTSRNKEKNPWWECREVAAWSDSREIGGGTSVLHETQQARTERSLRRGPESRSDKNLWERFLGYKMEGQGLHLRLLGEVGHGDCASVKNLRPWLALLIITNPLYWKPHQIRELWTWREWPKRWLTLPLPLLYSWSTVHRGVVVGWLRDQS